MLQKHCQRLRHGLAKYDQAGLVRSHDKNLPIFHASGLEKALHCTSQFRRTVCNSSGRRGNFMIVQKRLPQLEMVAMDDCARVSIRLVNCGVGQRFGRGNSRAFASQPVPSKIKSHYSRQIRRGQIGDSASPRAGDVKSRARAVAHAQISKANAVRVDTNHSQTDKFAAAVIQLPKTGERSNLRGYLLAAKLYCFAHDACSGKSWRMLFSFASQIPRSVMSPVTKRRGVTSNP